MELFEALDNMVIQTRFQNDGAFNTQSSKEYFVQLILDNVPITENDIFVDVGCGVGKVLSMLNTHSKLTIIGVEIDPIVAAFARDRVKDMDNVRVITGNILDCKSEIMLATVFYLFNPFNSNVLDSFLALVEEIGRKDVRIIYSNDVYKQVFEKHHWELIPYKSFIPLEKTGGISVWKRNTNP